MLGLSIWKIAIIGGIVVLLFGRGKVSELMGDVAKGIKSFKKGMAEDEAAAKPEADRKVLEEAVAKPAERAGTENSKAS